MIDPREGKLPVWAQQLLRDARRIADIAENRLQTHLDTVSPSPIWYGDYQNPIYVPVDHGYQTVYFNVRGENSSKSTFDEIAVQYRKGVLQIQGGGPVLISPTASNCFYVSLKP